jgi:Zn-dependent protease with chaperone function
VREFRAVLYDGRQAGGRAVVVSMTGEDDALRVVSEAGESLLEVSPPDYAIEPQLGSLPRRIRLADGAMLEVASSDWPPDFPDGSAAGGLMHRLHRAESSTWGWAVAVAGVIACFCFLYFFALPWAARAVAEKLPEVLTTKISQEILDLLDGKMFDPSQMAEARQEALREGFSLLAGRAEDWTSHEIIFRSSRLGPNAFALPGGQILMTDELVELAGSDEEVYLVMAHELGHIHHRHGMRMVLQSAGLVVAAAFFLGDMSSVAQLAGALPVILVESGYSRQFEHEADEYAARFGLASGIGVQPLVDFFQRIERLYGEEPLPWMSTHPATKDRIERIQRLVD